eukprot:CAMPEP_0115144468 /NCGR_PEP_ID=MMETSP0227-20121206/61516_1 /TAXON_ID=89957 /ORGANISM="Polarella glacialis, Strain CCMP 1383" /LENGTH=61 /DNA_ID=CAMNT_0002553757 /DNA_START=8 /DNA_END=190 /DNA_ORIENTATION=-
MGAQHSTEPKGTISDATTAVLSLGGSVAPGICRRCCSPQSEAIEIWDDGPSLLPEECSRSA